MLKGKKILVGSSGSIAAYKTALLVRLLVKQGAEVKVVATPGALEFITPLTLATLSNNPVYSQFTYGNQGLWTNHVELGLWADLMVIAPASANTLGKMANGLCDNLLLATYLSARCPVYFAPAMDLDMYQHPSVKENIAKLISFRNKLIDAETGELASGLHGQGRMAEPEHIVTALENHFTTTQLKKQRVLITAGPTVENIDPVRFISNHSTGKMGFAIAECFANLGYSVDLVTGPVRLQTNNPLINRIDIETAQQMQASVGKLAPKATYLVFAAAVADYRVEQPAQQKIKKEKSDSLTLSLVPNPDILAGVAKAKKKGQVVCGFALETNNAIANATKKLKAKNLDLIVVNTLEDSGAGFGHDTNKITIITAHNKTYNFELKTKAEAAADIVQQILTLG